jgi:hypothetical protein
MKKIANAAAYFFIITSLILTVISVAGVWGMFNGDVIWKSFESIGLIAFASIVVMISDSFSAGKAPTPQEFVSYNASIENFKSLRAISNSILIFSVAVSVFMGLLSIWDVVQGKMLYTAIATLAIVGFYGLLTTIVCSKRMVDLKASTKLSVQPQTATPSVAPAPATPVAPQVQHVQAEVPPMAPVAPAI